MSSEWGITKLGNMASLKTGKLDSNAAEEKGCYPFFTCSPNTLAINSFAFDTEAVILAGNNANGVFSCKHYSGKFNAYQRTYVIEPLSKAQTSSRYLFYVISHQINNLKELSVGSATKFLTKTILNNLPVVVPQIKEQERIVEFLSALDDRITLLRQTNSTLEAIAQALFKSWFVDFDPVRAKMEGRAPEGMDEATAALFPDSFEESGLGLVPRGWLVGTLADLASYQNGYAFKTKDWSEEGHPVIKIGNVKPRIIEIAGASYVLSETIVGLDRFHLKRGDLLVGMTGYVGETGLVPEIEPAAYLNQRVGKISTENGISDLGFVYCIVRNPAYKIHAESKSHGSAQANVSGTDLMSYSTVLPNLEVLAAFNQILAVFIRQILDNYDKSQTLSTLRDTLLPRLISGQLLLSEVDSLR